MKIIHTSIVFIIVLALCMTSCTKEIDTDIKHDPQTVIFGSISNETAPVSITIQQTVPVNSLQTSQTVNDASITLYTRNQAGVEEEVTSDFTVTNGTYTSTTPIVTSIGNSYWIEVRLADNTIFTSEAEELLPVVPITSLGLDDDELVRIRFSDPANTSNFYKYTVNLYDNGVLVSTNRSEDEDLLFDGNANAFVEIDRERQRDDDDDDDDTVIPHDEVEVFFCTVNLRSYQFYLKQSLEADVITSGDGSLQLFATPPVNLIGNIRNTTEDKEALGNFTVNSVSTQRENVTL